MSFKFNGITGVIMDMDGVLWRGNQPLPGIAEWVGFLRQQGIAFAMATNNSAKSPFDYVDKLAGMGVNDIKPEQIITSGTATVDYLKEHYAAATRIHVMGGDGLRQLIRDAGFTLANTQPVEVVVCGIDFALSYEAAKLATQLIVNGADFVGTNPDVSFPTPDGIAPGAGSIIALLETASGKTPVIIGKPERAMFDAALHVLGTAPEHTLMIGDRLSTDIAGAKTAGMQTALVLTGVTAQEQLADSDLQPDLIADNLPAMLRLWRDEL